MSSYTIEATDGRILVHGSVPITEIAELTKLWAKRGLDTLALGVSTALGASMAVCRKDDVDKWTKEVEQRATTKAKGNAELEWLLGPDTGTSSLTMFLVLCSTDEARNACQARLGSWGPSHPHDPDDFGRCHRLLEKFPAWREQLPRVARIFPKWARLIERWDEVTTLYLEELPTGRCRKAYDLMKSLTS